MPYESEFYTRRPYTSSYTSTRPTVSSYTLTVNIPFSVCVKNLTENCIKIEKFPFKLQKKELKSRKTYSHLYEKF